MEDENLIAATEICFYHDIDHTFISSLYEAGLVNVKYVEQHIYIPESELKKLEKMIRLHHELGINLAGIEAISHLLERVEQMQNQIRTLRNRAYNF